MKFGLSHQRHTKTKRWSIGLKSLTFFFAVLLFLNAFAPLVFADVTTSETQTSSDFTDVNRTHPHYTAITYLTQKGVVSGYEDKSFKPGNGVIRAEILKIIIKGSNLQTDVPFSPSFPDVTENDWFSPFVMKAKALGFVTGNQADGHFSPERQVNLAEFLKMLLEANNIDVSSFQGKQLAPNIPVDAWYANYLNYAISLGIVPLNADGTIDAAKALTRDDVVSTMYLFSLILNGHDTPFLLSRAEAEMAQIEVYIAANMVTYAKKSSGLAVDITQKAYKNAPTDPMVLGAAKIAKAYDWLVDSFVLGIQTKNVEAAQKANDAIKKATEAWQANNATQPIAKHIKDRAREILVQVGGVEE